MDGFVSQTGGFATRAGDAPWDVTSDPPQFGPDPVLDVVVITEDGYGNFTGFQPVAPEATEAVMREEGLLEQASARSRTDR